MSHFDRRLIPIEDQAAWNAALRDIPHGFAHTHANCLAMQHTTLAPTFLYHHSSDSGRIVCPISERRFGEYIDIFTPPGFSGFAASVRESAELFSDWQEFALSKQYVCGFITLNPLFMPASLMGSTERHEYNDLYVVELAEPEHVIFGRISETNKQKIKKSAKEDILISDKKSRFRDYFLSNANVFLKVRGAKNSSLLSLRTLVSLFDLDSVFSLAAIQDGNIKSVALFAWSPYCGEYLMSVSEPEARDLTAMLIWEGIRRLKSLGVPFLNLGGGARRGDGIASFKARFGANVMPLAGMRQIYRSAIYEELCLGTLRDTTDSSEYFPAFRR